MAHGLSNVTRALRGANNESGGESAYSSRLHAFVQLAVLLMVLSGGA